jgi:sugar lactone lactonase YvrE
MRPTVRTAATTFLTLGLVVAGGTPGQAATEQAAPAAGVADPQEHRAVFPATVALPDGFRPEGIAIGPGPMAYLGSLADGSIYRVDLRTGKGAVVSQGPGTPTVGVKTDQSGRLFAAGGAAGNARVIDTHTGRVLAGYQFTTGPSFVNDVVLTAGAAWFTDSTNPVLYRVPLGPAGEPAGAAERLPLTGDMVYGPGNNANGIAQTPDRRGLLVVQSNTGLLFRVDPATGVTRAVDLGGEKLVNGDGLLLQGRTLYVVQNRLNTVAVLRLDAAGTTARVAARLTDPRFDVPTTVAAFDGRLYLPNARFTTTPTPTTPYDLVAIPRTTGG